MPTLEGLSGLGLRFADTRDAPTFGERTVVGVWPAPDPWGGLADVGRRGMLLAAAGLPSWLSPPADRVLQSLAGDGVSGIAVRADRIPAATLAAARAHRLPILVLDPGVSVPRLTQAVSDLRLDEETLLRESIEQLHAHARQLATGRWEHIVRWLRRDLAPGKVLVVDPDEEIKDLPIEADRLTDLREGRLGSACAESGPWTIRMYGLGKARPRPVLIVALSGLSFAGTTARTLNLALPYLELAVEARRAIEFRQASEQDRRHAEVGLLGLLLSGDLRTAQQTAELLRLSSDLMGASTARVFLIRTPARRRECLAAACEGVLKRGHLVVRNPASDNDITIVARDDMGFSAEAALRAVVADRPGHHLGISRPVLLRQIPTAHAEAQLALDAAVQCGMGVKSYDVDGLAPLLLSADARAWAWADRFLDGLDTSLDAPSRRTLLTTVALWLRCGTREAARRSRLSPKTLRIRVRRVEDALGLNLEVFGHRVALDLATRIALLPEPEEKAVQAPILEDLLARPFVRQWAERLLDSLPDDSRRIRRTVIAWLEAGCQSAPAASALGLTRRSVNLHLAAAEAALRTRLLTSPPTPDHLISGPDRTDNLPPPRRTGPVDLALAALALGHLSYQQAGLTLPDRLRILTCAPPVPVAAAPPTDRGDETLSPVSISAATPDGTAPSNPPWDESTNQTRRYMQVFSAANRIGHTHDVMITAQQLADSAALLGDRAVVYLADECFTGKTPPRRRDGGDPALRSAAIAPLSAHWPAGFLLPGDDVPLLPNTELVRRHGDPHVLTNRTAIYEALGNRPEAIRQLVPYGPDEKELAVAIAPLVIQNLTLGSVQVWLEGTTFTTDDIRVLHTIAIQAAVSVDNACRHARQQNTTNTAPRTTASQAPGLASEDSRSGALGLAG